MRSRIGFALFLFLLVGCGGTSPPTGIAGQYQGTWTDSFNGETGTFNLLIQANNDGTITGQATNTTLQQLGVLTGSYSRHNNINFTIAYQPSTLPVDSLVGAFAGTVTNTMGQVGETNTGRIKVRADHSFRGVRVRRIGSNASVFTLEGNIEDDGTVSGRMVTPEMVVVPIQGGTLSVQPDGTLTGTVTFTDGTSLDFSLARMPSDQRFQGAMGGFGEGLRGFVKLYQGEVVFSDSVVLEMVPEQ